MIPDWHLLLLSLAYIAILFAVAWYGDKRAISGNPVHNRPLVYSLSLAVYCTSWTFYGAVGQAASSGWLFMAIYVGPIIFLLLLWPLLERIIRITKEKRLTSIADFIATRYGKDHSLAILVTVVAVVGVIPYIALQLKAISTTYELLTQPLGFSHPIPELIFQDTAFYITLLMALFVVMFGTRDIDASEQHPGMILAVAFESVVKLVAMVAVGLWAIYSLYDTPGDVVRIARETDPNHPLFNSSFISVSFMLQTLLAGIAILCLPRQFQVGVIENESTGHIQSARWMFPLYLALMLLFVAPLALSGHLFMKDLGFSPDSYVVSLPLTMGADALAMFAFIGGASAATGMIIVATIAVSTMISNEVVLPVIFRRQQRDGQQLESVHQLVLTVRRLVIGLLLLSSYVFYRFAGGLESLAAIGLLSFAAIAQFAPALFGGLLWQGGNRQGAIAGILGGIFIWFQQLFWPVVSQQLGADSVDVLIPYALLGFDMDDFSFAVIVSLMVNITLYIVFSVVSTAPVRERMLANEFTSMRAAPERRPKSSLDCKVDDVRVVLERILGQEKSDSFFHVYQGTHGLQYDNAAASNELLHDAEELLGSVVGSSSARLIFSTLLGGEQIQLKDLTLLASEASNAYAMSREQLQAALENIRQGVSVIDRDLKLVAWNNRYSELFEYPSGFIHVGKPIEDVIAYNAMRGFCGEGEVEEQVQRRMQFLRTGSAHEFERQLPNGVVVSMQGHPMPDGGFVTSFTDITVHRQAERALKEANISLERRVEKRSEELDELAAQLIEANQSKTRFLAATGHDLMQPLNAAKLFASTLAQQSLSEKQSELLQHLEGSLQSAEEVLSHLVEISKLDSGNMEPKPMPVSLERILKPLRDEFGALAQERGIKLTVRYTTAWVISDAHWLRRIIQNFISNAVRYTESGGILVGCRFRGDTLRLEVWDTGPGIPDDKIEEIFREFRRLNNTPQDSKGLGLGLAIVERMAKRMDHPIQVTSKPGAGTCFAITLPLTAAQAEEAVAVHTTPQAASFAHLKAFCIDNDPEVLEGMKALLSSWGCDIFAAQNEIDAEDIPFKPDIMLADFQLDGDVTGLDVMSRLREKFGDIEIPGILITADPRSQVAEKAKQDGYQFLGKPVRPASLRALMRRIAKH